MQESRTKYLLKPVLITLILLSSLTPGLLNAGNLDLLKQKMIYCGDDIADSPKEIIVRAFDHL